MNEQQTTNLDKRSTIFGFVGGVLVLCTIGFFILLGIVLNDTPSTKSAGTNPSVVAAPSPSAAAAAPSPSAPIQLAEITEEDHIRGDIDAPITIVEFSDIECPFCKRFHPTMQQVLANYSGQVRWVYKHFPLESIHRNARREAEATECAAKLGGNDGFWAYLDAIFEQTPSNDGLPSSALPQIAEDVGLDRVAFTECLDSGEMTEVVTRHSAEAVAAGGQGTPYSIIETPDGERIPLSGALPFEQIKQVIDSIL